MDVAYVRVNITLAPGDMRNLEEPERETGQPRSRLIRFLRTRWRWSFA